MKIEKEIYEESLEKLNEGHDVFYFSDVGKTDLPVQSHPYYEMYMLISGEVAYQTKKGVFILHPGDMLFLDIYARHCPIVLNPTSLYERITLNITPEKLKQLSNEKINLAECFYLGIDGAFRFPYPIQNSIRFTLGKLLGLKQTKPFGYELLSDAYLVELFVTISEHIHSESSMMTASELKAHQLLVIIDQYINENIENDIRIEDLSKFVCMNKYSLMRTFKDITSKSIYQYIINKRLVAAEEKIKSGMSYMTAAHNCGFSDYSCFYRSFVHHYNMSPKEYFSGTHNLNSSESVN